MSQTFKPPFVAFDDIEIGDNISDQSKTRMAGVSDEFCLSLEAEDGSANLLQPLVVREGGPARKTGKRRVVLDCGFRRYGGIKRLRGGEVPGQKTNALSWRQIPVRYVKGDEQDQDTRNLIENLQRLNLDPYEEAAAMLVYLDKYKVTQAMLAARISKSEPYVSQRLTMLRGTTEEVRQAFRDGVITPTHIREIVELPKDKQPEFIAALRAQAAQGKYASVADVKEDIATKAPRNKKKTGRKATLYDQEKVSAAKEAYSDKKFAPRPRPALVEVLGTLVMRERRNETDKTKHQIQAIEWVLGVRDSL
jgi:ParB/RepB/Spo0J family partition protein